MLLGCWALGFGTSHLPSFLLTSYFFFKLVRIWCISIYTFINIHICNVLHIWVYNPVSMGDADHTPSIKNWMVETPGFLSEEAIWWTSLGLWKHLLPQAFFLLGFEDILEVKQNLSLRVMNGISSKGVVWWFSKEWKSLQEFCGDGARQDGHWAVSQLRGHVGGLFLSKPVGFRDRGRTEKEGEELVRVNLIIIF